jgi:hypothetical protein
MQAKQPHRADFRPVGAMAGRGGSVMALARDVAPAGCRGALCVVFGISMAPTRATYRPNVCRPITNPRE